MSQLMISKFPSFGMIGGIALLLKILEGLAVAGDLL